MKAGGSANANDDGWPGSLGDWWRDGIEDEQKQKIIYFSLAGAYSLLGLAILIQLIRIQKRVPEYGWTTQKVFHLLGFLQCVYRAVVFGFRTTIDGSNKYDDEDVTDLVLLDGPGLLFFTTYTLLLLFWAEIYHQARSLPFASLRPLYAGVNCLCYVVQGIIWVLLYRGIKDPMIWADKCFSVTLCLFAVLGFSIYGGRLYFMLKRFPIESVGRRKKLWEVGLVMSICIFCFMLRAAGVIFSLYEIKVNNETRLDALNHPLLNAAYYSLVEIFPTAMVLFILKKLPPKRSGQYQPLPSGP